eukprot:TRINITY_DN37252_c0_g1_i1.p1 TRINITY_DN37252_c0_g1~~TRINITY_DN37252_c0_g1_i1.p1  ORF type:complete len:116 (+),score=21.26 TRINITY_DN37252_c0_g1_i1:37-384(+)
MTPRPCWRWWLAMILPMATPAEVAGQRASLVELYQATEGAGWANSTGWNTSQSICQWYGVICNGTNVTSLRLRRNQLSGTLPPGLASLSVAYWIELSQNQLHGCLLYTSPSPRDS